MRQMCHQSSIRSVRRNLADTLAEIKALSHILQGTAGLPNDELARDQYFDRRSVLIQ